MLSMVNANRFIKTVVIPLVIVAYAVFLWIDHNANYFAATKIHMQNIKNVGRVDGLLFGGSNAAYSVSAEFLSHNLGKNWYNASVMGELGTIQRHKNFIRDLSTRIDRTKVRYVVYSTVAPYHTGAIARLESGETLRLGIKPKISALGYMRHPFRESEFPQRNRFGDVVFENVNCDFTDARYLVKHEREDEDISV